MTTAYKQTDNVFRMAEAEHYKLCDKLPTGTYSLRNDIFGFYFEQIDNFTLPKKRYGDNQKLTDKILHTFNDRPTSTSILLSGQKGSGKTLLTKTIAQYGLENDIPTIVIAEPYAGTAFNLLLQKLVQPAIILIDEVEKVYSDSETQEKLLSLLDGIFPSKKLFLLTCNEPYKLSQYMFNRPGRIYYHVHYGCLSPEFVREYAEDNLANKDRIGELVNFAESSGNLNFDMVKAIVEEMNRYNESVSDSLKYLNVELERSSKSYQIVNITHEDGELTQSSDTVYIDITNPDDSFSIYFNPACPFTQEEIEEKLDVDEEFTVKYKKWEASLKRRVKGAKKSHIHDGAAHFEVRDLISRSPNGKQLTFRNEIGFTVSLQELKKKPFSARNIMYSNF